MSPLLLFQWFFFCFHILSTCSTSNPFDVPRLSPIDPRVAQDLEGKFMSESTISNDCQTFFYKQTLDHFNYKSESYQTFKQRFVINNKYWGGASSFAPIFAYLGSESPLDGQLSSAVGLLLDNAPKVGAYLLFMEHRFYGQSSPLGSQQAALSDKNIRGVFDSAQAIADYVEIILYVKEQLRAKYSPVIVFGGSYGGLLATWLRLKYPHIALGALASSAPILLFDDITPADGYYFVVSKDFWEASQSCYYTIKRSWQEIDRVASQPGGLEFLRKKFRTCNPLNSADELKNNLAVMYAQAAQYNSPPRYPVYEICQAIDTTSGNDIFDKIFAGVYAYRGTKQCYVNRPSNQQNEKAAGWAWQTCSEMVMPIGRGVNSSSMFQPDPFNLNDFIQYCQDSYGVSPRPHWVTTYYGGHDMKLTLNRFGSNIIFSNGLQDPYSIGGILKDISDTIVAITTAKGSHCLDLRSAQETDPDWLIKQRQNEIRIIVDWINKYYDDLSRINPITSTFKKMEE